MGRIGAMARFLGDSSDFSIFSNSDETLITLRRNKRGSVKLGKMDKAAGSGSRASFTFLCQRLKKLFLKKLFWPNRNANQLPTSLISVSGFLKDVSFVI